MTGHGGWPMTVFLTPEGVPFYGGTYFPPEDRQGMPAFPRVLQGVATAYRDKRGEVAESGRQLLEQMRQGERLRASATVLTDEVLFAAFQGVSGQFDERDGGTAGAPKFPQPMIWESVLRFWRRTGNPRALDMVEHTLTRMARGGMYDQLGGGFHRYSVDAHWLVPHFEKMLYDNAQLARLYLHAWLATGNAELRRVTEETLDYLLREMRHPAGGFFSAQDADSEGVEGKFFVWTADELRAALGDEEVARVALAYWGVDAGPNFEGHSILHVPRPPKEIAERHGLSEEALAAVIARARRTLYPAPGAARAPGPRRQGARRLERPRPRRLRRGGTRPRARGLSRRGGSERSIPHHGDDPRGAAPALVEGRRGPHPRLPRGPCPGGPRAPRHLRGHLRPPLAGRGARARRRGAHASSGTPRRRPSSTPAATRKPWWCAREASSTTPCPAAPRWRSSCCFAWPRIPARASYERQALRALRPMADVMTRYPTGFGRYLGALDFHLGPVAEVALVWPAGTGPAGPLLDTVYGRYLPNRVVAGAAEGAPDMAGLPLLEGKRAEGGRVTAYVCRKYVCQAPTSDPELLARQLDGGV